MSQPPESRSGERIAKLLARAGVASRREVERMIEDGRVALNDEVLTTPATILPNLKGVTVDGKPVRAAEAARLFVFHKPAGLLTAERDYSGRPTIYTALRNALPEGTPRLMPVGRLDFNTEGLLILTNDGELKRAMELPSSGIPRTYRARTFGAVTQQQLEDLSEGIEIEGVRYGSINANMERSAGRNQWIEVTITEGKNREVRRVLEHLGLEVSRLIRTSYGPFELLDLPRGMAVEIRPADVEKFAKALSIGKTDEIKVERVAMTPKAPKPSPERGGGPLPKAVVEGARGQAPRKPKGLSVARSAAAPSLLSPPKGREASKRPRKSDDRAEPPRPPRAPSVSRSETATSPSRGGSARPGKPARKSDDHDRGEKLLDRPKAHRKPSGWAKAKPKPGKPGGRK